MTNPYGVAGPRQFQREQNIYGAEGQRRFQPEQNIYGVEGQRRFQQNKHQYGVAGPKSYEQGITYTDPQDTLPEHLYGELNDKRPPMPLPIGETPFRNPGTKHPEYNNEGPIRYYSEQAKFSPMLGGRRSHRQRKSKGTHYTRPRKSRKRRRSIKK